MRRDDQYGRVSRDEKENRKALRRGAFFACILFLGTSCDILRDPILCNGFERQIEITVISGQGRVGSFVSLEPQTCGELSASKSGHSEINTSDAVKRSGIEMIVRSAEEEVLAKISIGSDEKVINLSGLNWKPYWLVTPTGLFLMPKESYEGWQAQIDLIEKSSQISFPVQKQSL